MWLLPRFFKLWLWVDLDLFYVKVKFGYIGFRMGESENYLFCGNYCSLRSQSCLMHSAKWVNEIEWVSKVKVILWPWSKVTQISKLNVWLWTVYSGERFRASWPSCFFFFFFLLFTDRLVSNLFCLRNRFMLTKICCPIYHWLEVSREVDISRALLRARDIFTDDWPTTSDILGNRSFVSKILFRF